MRFFVLGFVGWVLSQSAAIGAIARADLVASPPCTAGETYVHVRTQEHTLYLCENGKVRESYPVTLGATPGAKQRQGDHRTPLGRYRLNAPRRSDNFAWFVGVGYPTPQQRAQGYTGSAVGIHGPPRKLARIGVRVPDFVLAMNWTDGCVAVGSDGEIEAIVEWLKRAKARTIAIE
jgi:murein L,D-transpeptidase YafK